MDATLARLIDTVSPSRLETAERCLAQFFYRYVQRSPFRYRSELSFGRAVDDCGNGTYAEKIKSGETPTKSDVQERFAAAWDFEAVTVDVWNEGADKDSLMDLGTKAVALWHDRIAVHVKPIATQEKLTTWVTDPITGQGFNLLTVLDVRAEVNGVPQVVDLKTSGKAYRPDSMTRKAQPPAYSIAANLPTFSYHVLVTTKSPQTQVLTSPITDSDRRGFLIRAGMIRRQIAHAFRTGDWLPNRTGFMCTRRHCEHWESCERDFGGRVAP